MASRLLLICCSCLLSVSLFSQAVKSDSTTIRKKKSGIPKIKIGTASYYDNKFEGRKTASGEVYTQKKLTAASNTLPLQSWVKVTNLSNNRSVIVRINDRMHPKNRRLIDLSRAAASKLSFIGKGLTKVKVEYLGKKKPENFDEEEPEEPETKPVEQ
ncbi:MAG: septal ring lytic transglycosylase RlpA family protein [Chitinophagaceae bacterium]|uniref:septal ring lytic transglycosylase RlpA family protein n=1 Tax=unclassified Paraflavitalea TaxID=2798305 RepID=UPI003D3467DD|nr:septal ring lytic transglycosylase RlpA family protein [Chitinophagaceae bacterium]